ncbi:hypothetical protein JXA48_02975 [Candidatus Woesearchaeota archaeon]|nr:hypothetical protein [Candidatus Woesearchaeota archaeon]
MITTETKQVEQLREEMHKASELAEKVIESYRIVNSSKRVAEIKNWYFATQIFSITRIAGSDPAILANGTGFLGRRGYKHQLIQKLDDNPRFLTEELADCMGLAAIIEKDHSKQLLFGHLYSKEVFSTLISMIEYFGNREYKFNEVITSPLDSKFKQTPNLEKVRKLLIGVTPKFTELNRIIEGHSTMYANKHGVILGNNTYQLWKND